MRRRRVAEEFRTRQRSCKRWFANSREKNIDPEQTLEEAYPMLERLAARAFAGTRGFEEARKIQPSLKPERSFAQAEVLRCVQALEDTELYQVKTSDGQTGR